jgi:hypothetical protein
MLQVPIALALHENAIFVPVLDILCGFSRASLFLQVVSCLGLPAGIFILLGTVPLVVAEKI